MKTTKLFVLHNHSHVELFFDISFIFIDAYES